MIETATKKVRNKEIEGNSPRDLTMEDMEHKRYSFEEVLFSNVRANLGTIKEEFEKEDLDIFEDDVMNTLDGPYPDVLLSDRVQDILDKNMEQIVVVKLLGRLIGYKALLNRI